MKTKNKSIPLRIRLANAKTIAVILLCLIALITARCAKDRLISDAMVGKTLSTNSPDYLKRLSAIKDRFYSSKFEQKLIANVNQKYYWIPDWEHPSSQVVNDTVSYVFFPLIAYVKENNATKTITELGSAHYLIVKNEKEFYKAFYYQPKAPDNTSKLAIDKFTGNLLLTNFENGKSYLLDYVEGKVSQSYQKRKMLALNRESITFPNKTSYWESICHTELKYCTWASDGPTNCNSGTVHIIYSPNCNWPQGNCGSNYSLIDSSEITVCENQWFPDPPTDPGTGGGGGGGGSGGEGDFNPVNLSNTITMDPNTRPCLESIKNSIVSASQFSVTMANLLKQVHNDNTKAQNAVLALANNPNVSITLGEKTIPYQTITLPDGTTRVSETHGQTDPITGNIKLNTLTLNEASDMAITASLIHEMMHAYFVWGANNLTGEEGMAFSDLNRYLFNQEDGTPHPYNYPELGAMQHMQMAETYVNSMAKILMDVSIAKGYGASPDTSISMEQYCRDIFWGSLQQTSGLEAPDAARSKTNAEREYKNQTGSTGKKDCQP
jgi:hypothetical protein